MAKTGKEGRGKMNVDNGASDKGEHNYSGHNPFEMWSGHGGRPAQRGPGPVAGAGEVVSGSPGTAAGRVNQGSENAKFLGAQPMEKTASTSKTPKGMKTQYEGM